MLLQFSVSNFRSFRQRQTFNLAASAQDKALPENCIPLELPGVAPKQWLKGAAIYGANASGKTTVLEGLKALARMVQNSAKMTDPKEAIPVIEPFALKPETAEVPTAFEVMLVAEGVRYAYAVAATRERIWHESLRAYPTATAQTWFSRDWNAKSRAYEWSPERPTGFKRDPRLEGDTLSNMLFLSKHIASNRTELEPIFRWFKDRLNFLHLDANWQLGGDFTLRQMHEKTPLAGRIVELLRHADLGVTGARVIEHAAPKDLLEALQQMPAEMQEQMRERLKNPFYQPELTHRGAESTEYPLPWDAESAGTHRLFALAGPWLSFLADGDVVCIDELDTSMHPLMAMELLRLLFSEKESPSRAQVIFTTHNPLLLDMTFMRRDQVWFTDKDRDGEGHLYPLTEYAPRKEESLIRGYLSGRYGAVPFLREGLLGQKRTYEVVAAPETPAETGEMRTKRKLKPSRKTSSHE